MPENRGSARGSDVASGQLKDLAVAVGAGLEAHPFPGSPEVVRCEAGVAQDASHQHETDVGFVEVRDRALSLVARGPARIAGDEECRPARLASPDPVRYGWGHEREIVVFVREDLKLPARTRGSFRNQREKGYDGSEHDPTTPSGCRIPNLLDGDRRDCADASHGYGDMMTESTGEVEKISSDRRADGAEFVRFRHPQRFLPCESRISSCSSTGPRQACQHR